MAESTEIEVKLLVDRRGIQQLSALPMIGTALKRAPRKHIETCYYDTPDHLLEREGFVLRLRKGDGAPLLSIKQQAATVRKEWERRIAGDEPQSRDWRGTPVEPLLKRKTARANLRPLFATVIDRASFETEYDGALIEVALDRGEIKHDGRELPVSEIELELKRGAPEAVFALARELAGHASLRLGLLSKGERGQLLNNRKWGAPRTATRPGLGDKTGLGAGIQIICQTCLKDFAVNDAALAEGYDEEAVHQGRIAIRRLRTALALFKSTLAGAELERLKREIGWLWDVSGRTRDLDVMARDVEAETSGREMPAGATMLIELVAARRDEARAELMNAMRSDRARLLFIDLACWIENGDWLHGKAAELSRPIMEAASAGLASRLCKVKKRCRGIAKAKPRKQHRLRIAAKKLRLMCEFFESLLTGEESPESYTRLIAVLDRLQKLLGRLHDRATREKFLCELASEARTALHAPRRTPLEDAVKSLAPVRPRASKLLTKVKKSSTDLAAVEGFWD